MRDYRSADIPESINFRELRTTRSQLFIMTVTLHCKVRDKDNLGGMLEGYICYTYGTCTIAPDDSQN